MIRKNLFWTPPLQRIYKLTQETPKQNYDIPFVFWICDSFVNFFFFFGLSEVFSNSWGFKQTKNANITNQKSDLNKIDTKKIIINKK